MDSVWCVVCHFEGMTSSVFRVFKSKEKAEKYCAECNLGKNRNCEVENAGFDESVYPTINGGRYELS